ncbi:Spc7-domain-containing protein [Rhizodiscina lignyota]|uniref:Spc7-domain-containing protein n=1 Tax=Rhizodiscina lignyota TaxID=1504668 RepID=A0A9P4M9Q8_9PEZI|nr:Spc7-domain-containing protein [Rhizodiscina lignyota]
MATESDKENIAESLTAPPKSPLAARKSGRSRSKSIGPHTGLTIPLKEETSNRRKSAVVPAMRSILSGKEDEDEAKKRKEARRKSLANRRVSFAPEATLHTWDVIEYMRDVNSTTSSATSSSNNSLNSSTRRSPSRSPQSKESSSIKNADSTDLPDPPSTPPEQVEETESEQSPANQREMHQKKRRRSSNGIPPMNFNNPEDAYSSSPISGSSSPAAPSPVGEEIESDSESDSENDADQTGTAMSVDMDEATGRSVASAESSNDSTGSSARLDEALRQATRQAGTQALDLEDDGEMSMEIAGDEVTNAFRPWMSRQQGPALPAIIEQDKGNMDPFSSTPKMPTRVGFLQPATSPTNDDGETYGISMDMTRAVGGIIPTVGVTPATSSETNVSSEGGTMDFTMVMPGSGILPGASSQPLNNDRRASLKRRRSSVLSATTGDDTGSPAKKLAPSRRTSIRASRRRSSVMTDEDAGGEETMDLTATLGAIQEDASQQQQLKPDSIPDEATRRASGDTSFGDEAMDMTMLVGPGITSSAGVQNHELDDTDEDLSMEVTTALGTIQRQVSTSNTQDPVTPQKALTEAQKESLDYPIEYPYLPIEQFSLSNSEIAREDSVHVKATPQKSPRRTTPRKSIIPTTPEAHASSSAKTTPANPPSSRSKSKRASLPRSVSPAKVTDTPVLAAPESHPTVATPVRIPESHVEAAMAQPSPTPKQNPSQPLPPVIRSPLAPKGDGTGNEMSQSQSKLSDSFKQLATPKKQMSSSPLKKVIASNTPRTGTKSPKKIGTPARTRTPRKSMSPVKKAVKMVENIENVPSENDATVQHQTKEESMPLQDFLNMTGIQFLDLQTTKRRHTGFPTLKPSDLLEKDEDELAGGDGLDSLERTVVAATTLVPELTMFQHSCHEMKSYLSSGKDVVRSIEAEVLEEQPPLFREYLSAPQKERHIMDDQFKAMKAHARLESKGTWYQWRSQLLKDLTGGLDETKVGMEDDENALVHLHNDLTSTLHALRERNQRLKSEASELRRKKAERESGEREELDVTRERLVQVDAELEEKKRVVESLRNELAEKEAAIEMINERKEECAAATKEAERVSEECRGLSTQDVSDLRTQVKELEATHHWSILSATKDPTTLTLAYRNEVDLFFHPFAFQDARSASSSPSKPSRSNAPISLTYNPRDMASTVSEEPTTVQRFFLQLLRANLHALPQSTTPISSLLKLVSEGWEKCRALAEAVRQLEILGICDVAILGDEMLKISVAVLLPEVETKVVVSFHLAVSVAAEADDMIDTSVKVIARVVYGERYDEPKMSEFLKMLIGGELLELEKMGVWYESVAELKSRLIKRGRKG